MCNTYCFSTATVVTRTRLSVNFIRTLPVFVLAHPSIHRRICPLYSDFPSLKTMFLYISLSQVSTSVSSSLLVNPSIFLSVYSFVYRLVPLIEFSMCICFMTFSWRVQTIVTVYLQLYQYFHTSIVAIVVSFWTFHPHRFLADLSTSTSQ